MNEKQIRSIVLNIMGILANRHDIYLSTVDTRKIIDDIIAKFKEDDNLILFVKNSTRGILCQMTNEEFDKFVDDYDGEFEVEYLSTIRQLTAREVLYESRRTKWNNYD